MIQFQDGKLSNVIVSLSYIGIVYLQKTCMISRILFFCIFALNSAQCWSQQQPSFATPNYAYIDSVTKVKNTIFYYPVLLKRYRHNDTTLSQYQIHLLYYGKFFQEGASIFDHNQGLNDSIKAVYKKETLTDNDLIQLLGYFLKLHDTMPFDLGTLYKLNSVCQKLNDARAAKYAYKLKMILQAIVATGDGRTENSGFHIGSVSDEYSFLSIMGLKFGGSQSLIKDCDYLKVGENKYDIKGIYFNIEQILAEERKLFGLDDFLQKTNKKQVKDEKQSKKKKDR